MAEVINGGCHCGNITLCFNISSSFDELPIRACQCSFCRKHNVRATADPNGELEVYIKDKSKLSKYRFGLGITDFLVCKECGIYVAAVMEDPENGKLLATCVVNALDVSDRSIQFFKNIQLPIKTSFLAATKVLHFCFSRLSEISILKSSASSLVWL